MQIEVTQVSGAKEIVKFSQENIIIVGRSKSAHIFLDGETISRDHLHIFYKDGKAFIEDQGSTYGVFIDDKKIPAFQPVEFMTFFPVRAGKNSFLSLISLEDSDYVEKPLEIEKTPMSLQASYVVYKQKHRKKSTLPIKKSANFKNSKSKSEPKITGLSVLGLMIIGLATWYTIATKHNEKTSEVSAPISQMSQLNQSELDQVLIDRNKLKIKEFLNRPKCSSKEEFAFCDTFRRGLTTDEGILVTQKSLAIFVDISRNMDSFYARYTKKIPLSRQIESLMYFEALNSERLELVVKSKLQNIFVISFENGVLSGILHINELDLLNREQLKVVLFKTFQEGIGEPYNELASKFPLFSF